MRKMKSIQWSNVASLLIDLTRMSMPESIADTVGEFKKRAGTQASRLLVLKYMHIHIRFALIELTQGGTPAYPLVF